MARRRVAAVAGVAAAVIGIAWLVMWSPDRTTRLPGEGALASVAADAGAFDRRCASCHGAAAAGTTSGPPLVHPVYRPGHHGDVSFELAVRRGVRAHHWRFGDMPPLPDVSATELAEIVRYVRALQRARGIE